MRVRARVRARVRVRVRARVRARVQPCLLGVLGAVRCVQDAALVARLGAGAGVGVGRADEPQRRTERGLALPHETPFDRERVE